MLQRYWSPLIFCSFWLSLMIVAVATRPPLPVDETRYLAVAWEMWLRGDFIVPYLNGETYSHKPPLLFWLMHLGWAIFGVNEWWPPLVAPLFGLASLFLTRKMAQKLWPDEPLIADLAPIMLMGAAFWALFTTLTMFDMLVTTCTLLGLLGILSVWRDGGKTGWILLALGIGIGVLAKGPVILLQILPLALTAPLWDVDGRIKERFGGWAKWYLGIFASVLGGAAIALAWAIPAAIYGGEEYRNAIFWGQTAGRMVKSFDHARPWWWYLAVIGPLLMPWIIWSAWGFALKKAGRKIINEMAVRFCLLWFIPIFIAFSLISGKQLHYLLPIFPAFTFLVCRLLVIECRDHHRWTCVIPAGFFFFLCLALIVLPHAGIEDLPHWAKLVDTRWMALPLLISLMLIIRPLDELRKTVTGLSLMLVVMVIGIHYSMKPYLAHSFDLHGLSHHVKKLQDQGYEVAFMGTYHGTFHFMGRLEKPIAELSTTIGRDKFEWLEENPKGKVITRYRKRSLDHPAIEYVQPFRRDHFVVIDVAKAKGDVDLFTSR